MFRVFLILKQIYHGHLVTFVHCKDLFLKAVPQIAYIFDSVTRSYVEQ